MTENNDICPCCGARTTKLRIMFSGAHLGALRKMADAGGVLPFGTKNKVGLLNSEYVRSTDLHHWGLTLCQNRGTTVTEKGYAFLAGEELIPAELVTYRAQVLEEGERLICIKDVDPDWDYEVIHNDE